MAIFVENPKRMKTFSLQLTAFREGARLQFPMYRFCQHDLESETNTTEKSCK
jgi:hypothetical protein